MSVLRVSSSSFRKTLNISYRKKNLIFLLSRTLPFACILSVHCAKGDVFQKLLLAVEYNKSNFNGFSKADTTASIQKRLPIFTKHVTNKFQQPDCLYRNFAGHKSLELNASKQKNQPIQTDQLTTETLKRFQSILSGPHVGAFCQVMDIFISGYGKLEIDSDVLCVRFLYEEKIKF